MQVVQANPRLDLPSKPAYTPAIGLIPDQMKPHPFSHHPRLAAVSSAYQLSGVVSFSQ